MSEGSAAEHRLGALAAKVEPVPAEALAATTSRLAERLTGPLPGEDLLRVGARICTIHDYEPPRMNRKLLLLCSADHGTGTGEDPEAGGWAGERVTAYLRGEATVNRLARKVGVRMQLLDVGVAGDFAEQPGLSQRKVAWGTAPLSQGPAMAREQAVEAMLAGYDVVAEMHEARAIDVVAVGSLTGGDPAPATLLAAGQLGLGRDELLGDGGVLEGALAERIEEAIGERTLSADDPLDLLSDVGGFELAAMAGAMLAAARNRVAIVADGVGSASAALLAGTLTPHVGDYLFFSHVGPHPLHRPLIQAQHGEPLVGLAIDGGEAVGSALALGVISSALALWSE